MDPKPRLSCEQCRRRKTKCDKKTPCTSCKSAGLVCEAVQRNRLPRGKSGKTRKKGGLLETRVSRIEKLLAQAQELSTKFERKASSNKSSPSNPLSSGEIESTKGLNNYVASDFWTELSQEIAGLRETFDGASDDEDLSPPDLANAYSKLEISPNCGAVLFGSSPASSDAHNPPYPPNDLRATLLAIFKYRVDTISKMIHWPTTLAKIEEANARQHEGSSTSEQALEFSIYCTAVCTITDEEAPLMLPKERSIMLQQYMHATEIALGQSNLMQRPDIAGLLALVLYINCVWACGRYATKWTLVALAARVGDALGLGREDPKMFTPFELECRRRLWHGIGLLDVHCSYDRGSAPLIKSEALGPMPLNINDADMSPDSTELVPSEGFTDMAFALLTFEAAVHNKQTCETADWNSKLRIVQSFQDVAQRAISVASGDSPLERLNREYAGNIASNMHLLIRRPPYKQRGNTVPESDKFDIMGCAITVLEGYLQKKQGDLMAWEWKDWVPWYALAVVLAELCKTPTGPVADRAWVAAQELYQIHARPTSDLETGMLWKPLTKLMRRVQRERMDATQGVGTYSSEPPIPMSRTPLQIQNYTAISNTNVPTTLSTSTYDTTLNMSNSLQQTLPNQPWTAGGMPAWPVFNPTTSLFESNNRDLNSKLYNDLDPANGVSWLDWEVFLDDPGYAMYPT